MIFVGLVVLGAIGNIGSGSKDTAPTSGNAPTIKTPRAFGQTEICIFAREEVKKNLKAPSTAKFSGLCNEYKYSTRTENGLVVWTVMGQVDAQNSFGAMLRSIWIAEVTDVGDGDRYRAHVVSIN